MFDCTLIAEDEDEEDEYEENADSGSQPLTQPLTRFFFERKSEVADHKLIEERFNEISLILMYCEESANSTVGVLDGKSFYEIIRERNVMSSLQVRTLQLIMSWKCGQAINVALIIMWTACLVKPGWVFPKTAAALPGLIPVTSILLIAVSVCTIFMFATAQRLAETSLVFKSLVTYSLHEIQAKESLLKQNHPTVMGMVTSYLTIVTFGLMVCILDLDFIHGHFSPLAPLCVVLGMVQPWMGQQVAVLLVLVKFVGSVPGKNLLLYIQQKEKTTRLGKHGMQQSPSFWRTVLGSYQMMERGLDDYYADASLPILSAMATLFMLLLGCSALIKGGATGISQVWILDFSGVVAGLFFGVSIGIHLIKELMAFASTTSLCSGTLTYKNPPCIFSAACKFLSMQNLSDSERTDLDRFLFYVNQSNAGVHLLGVGIDSTTILKLAAGATAFSWLVSELVALVSKGW